MDLPSVHSAFELLKSYHPLKIQHEGSLDPVMEASNSLIYNTLVRKSHRMIY